MKRHDTQSCWSSLAAVVLAFFSTGAWAQQLHNESTSYTGAAYQLVNTYSAGGGYLPNAFKGIVTGGHAIQGEASGTGGVGVYGSGSSNSIGVYAFSNDSIAMYALANSGTAISASTNSSSASDYAIWAATGYGAGSIRAQQTGSGYALYATSSDNTTPTVRIVQSGSGANALTVESTRTAVYGSASGGTSPAISGYSSGAGNGVKGEATQGVPGVYGVNTGNYSGGYGVRGHSTNNYGAYGSSTNSVGVVGVSTYNDGVQGTASAVGYTGVLGQNNSGSNGYGLYGYVTGSAGVAVMGVNAWGTNGSAGYFYGNVAVIGTLSKGGGSFKIDHPLDPENKYLYHSFVESPDMKNIYDGVVTLDGFGNATVQLPDWFQALNDTFRYQLTCIGGYSPVFVSKEVDQNRFEIGGGKGGQRVSWQVTGIRKDSFAVQNRIPVEEPKAAADKGRYLYPTAFGQPVSKQLGVGPP